MATIKRMFARLQKRRVKAGFGFKKTKDEFTS